MNSKFLGLALAYPSCTASSTAIPGDFFCFSKLGGWVVFEDFTCSTRNPSTFHLRAHFYPAKLMKSFPRLNPQLWKEQWGSTKKRELGLGWQSYHCNNMDTASTSRNFEMLFAFGMDGTYQRILPILLVVKIMMWTILWYVRRVVLLLWGTITSEI